MWRQAEQEALSEKGREIEQRKIKTKLREEFDEEVRKNVRAALSNPYTTERFSLETIVDGSIRITKVTEAKLKRHHEMERINNAQQKI